MGRVTYVTLYQGWTNSKVCPPNWETKPYGVLFNKNNYTNLKAVYFVAAISVNDVTATGKIRLYNVTDGKEIEESTIETNETSIEFVDMVKKTSNLKDKLPDHEVALVFQLQVSEGFLIRCTTVYLEVVEE